MNSEVEGDELNRAEESATSTRWARARRNQQSAARRAGNGLAGKLRSSPRSPWHGRSGNDRAASKKRPTQARSEDAVLDTGADESASLVSPAGSEPAARERLVAVDTNLARDKSEISRAPRARGIDRPGHLEIFHSTPTAKGNPKSNRQAHLLGPRLASRHAEERSRGAARRAGTDSIGAAFAIESRRGANRSRRFTRKKGAELFVARSPRSMVGYTNGKSSGGASPAAKCWSRTKCSDLDTTVRGSTRIQAGVWSAIPRSSRATA